MKPNWRNEELLLMLENAVRSENAPASEQAWQKSYESFCQTLADESDKDCSPAAMRMLNHLLIELDTHRECLAGRHLIADTYCRKAAEAVKCELRIMTFRVKNPNFISDTSHSAFSPLHLNKEYHYADIVELITSLYELHVFCDATGRPAKQKTIIRVFETAFNIRLPAYSMMRTAIINRKVNATPFLDNLRASIIRLSQR